MHNRNRFSLQQHVDGQVYVSEDGYRRLHATLPSSGETQIQIAAKDVIEIDKMYGPLVFFPIRITCDTDSCEWVVERLMGDTDKWEEHARIPGQLPSDFQFDNI